VVEHAIARSGIGILLHFLSTLLKMVGLTKQPLTVFYEAMTLNPVMDW